MPAASPALSPAELDRFVTDGYVRLDDALPSELADQGRAILWRDTGVDPDDPATWTRPVIRLGGYHDLPFREAANTSKLHAAYDLLVGAGREGDELQAVLAAGLLVAVGDRVVVGP